MKIEIISLEEFENLLKGVIKIVEGCAIELTSKGAEIKVGFNGQIRAFFKTTCIRLLSSNNDDVLEICFEQTNKLLQAISFLKDSGIKQTVELETDGIFLYYKGKSKFKLKLDKKERVQNFLTSPLKTELIERFSFKITQENIDFIMKYSNFNTFEIKAYFYLKDNILYVDLDNKTESRISSVSIPLTEKYSGNLEEPFILALDDIKKFSVIDKENIKVNLTDRCIEVLSFRKTETCKTALRMIVTLRKD